MTDKIELQILFIEMKNLIFQDYEQSVRNDKKKYLERKSYVTYLPFFFFFIEQ